MLWGGGNLREKFERRSKPDGIRLRTDLMNFEVQPDVYLVCQSTVKGFPVD